MTWVRDPHGVARAYVLARTGDADTIGLEGLVAYVRMNPTLTAAICLHDFDGVSVNFSWAASPQARITRGDITRMIALAFDEIGARRISTRIRASNAKSLKAARAFGFVLEGTLRQSHKNGDDELIFSLLKHEARLSR